MMTSNGYSHLLTLRQQQALIIVPMMATASAAAGHGGSLYFSFLAGEVMALALAETEEMELPIS